ncbi:MAG: hypothetical protein IH599_02765, partial [Bacteroidales bacterium]|nr:hypothetical protein [Bacteroidales bacterium]
MFRLVPLLIVLLVWACDNPEEISPGTSLKLYGTGDFSFNAYAPLSNKPVQVFYHIPPQATSTSPILMVFTGAGRDALPSRDALIGEANQLGFIVV